MSDLNRSADIARALIESNAEPSVLNTPIMPSGAVIVPKPEFVSARELRIKNPALRHPVIHEILREGETASIIAGTKSNKSWLALDLAMSIATGRLWLNRFKVEQGNVLIVDNELHRETSAFRLPKVAEARGIPLEEIDESVFVENLRGRLVDMEAYFDAIDPGRFKVIVLDALYRFMPDAKGENDNSAMAQVYNRLDRYAAQLGCAFVCVHHPSKGSQSSKAIVDVGAGAGAQSRAADAHLVLRQHKVQGAVVVDGVVRSWPPLQPFCLKWDFPIWQLAPDLDPADLKPERPPRLKAEKPVESVPVQPADIWDVSRFVTAFCTPTPQSKDTIIAKACDSKLKKTQASGLLSRAEDEGKLHRWGGTGKQKLRFATVPEPKLPEDQCPKTA